jgi:hypothetical protein
LLSGDSENLVKLHAKRAVTRKLLVTLTGKNEDDVKAFHGSPHGALQPILSGSGDFADI